MGRMALAVPAVRHHASTVVDSTNLEPTCAASDERAVRRFKALGDPIRLRILQALCDGDRCVCEIQERVGVAANLLSHHLRVLREAGLVASQRRGRWIHYRLDPEGLNAAAGALPTPDGTAGVPGCACRAERASA